mmetsp:Transcript_15030/g.52779  ORF Transcript_15030/g.52779 Transcript_15030/m.52779 type:complete len:328 (+) Transcript_15030:403-1386(+)
MAHKHRWSWCRRWWQGVEVPGGSAQRARHLLTLSRMSADQQMRMRTAQHTGHTTPASHTTSGLRLPPGAHMTAAPGEPHTRSQLARMARQLQRRRHRQPLQASPAQSPGERRTCHLAGRPNHERIPMENRCMPMGLQQTARPHTMAMPVSWRPPKAWLACRSCRAQRQHQQPQACWTTSWASVRASSAPRKCPDNALRNPQCLHGHKNPLARLPHNHRRSPQHLRWVRRPDQVALLLGPPGALETVLWARDPKSAPALRTLVVWADYRGAAAAAAAAATAAAAAAAVAAAQGRLRKDRGSPSAELLRSQQPEVGSCLDRQAPARGSP